MDNKKELLFTITKDDLEIQTFCSGGKGGQNQNKRFTGVRIIHKESGAIGECREERDQLQNKRIALKRLTEHPKFKIWINNLLYKYNTGKTTEESVDEQMNSKNIKVEVKDENDRWIEESILEN